MTARKRPLTKGQADRLAELHCEALTASNHAVIEQMSTWKTDSDRRAAEADATKASRLFYAELYQLAGDR